jgi:hypothetical protein
MKVRSVGNTLTLHETALIEAFNLKAAIEYVLKNAEAAREALTDMPPRSEDELDAVTLHNQATKLNSNKNQQLILKFVFVNFHNCYLSSYKIIPIPTMLIVEQLLNCTDLNCSSAKNPKSFDNCWDHFCEASPTFFKNLKSLNLSHPILCIYYLIKYCFK